MFLVKNVYIKFDKKLIFTNLSAISNKFYYSDFLEILQAYREISNKIFSVKFMVPIQAWKKVIANQKSLFGE